MLSAIDVSLGACKKADDTVTTPEWEMIFSVVREMKEFRGYVTAMAAWTQVFFKVIVGHGSLPRTILAATLPSRVSSKMILPAG